MYSIILFWLTTLYTKKCLMVYLAKIQSSTPDLSVVILDRCNSLNLYAKGIYL